MKNKNFKNCNKVYDFLESYVTILKLTNENNERQYEVYRMYHKKYDSTVMAVEYHFNGFSHRLIFIELNNTTNVFSINIIEDERVQKESEESVIEYLKSKMS